MSQWPTKDTTNTLLWWVISHCEAAGFFEGLGLRKGIDEGTRGSRCKISAMVVLYMLLCRCLRSDESWMTGNQPVSSNKRTMAKAIVDTLVS